MTIQYFPVTGRPGYMIGSDGSSWKRLTSIPVPRPVTKKAIGAADSRAERRQQISAFLEESTTETQIEHERAPQSYLYAAYVRWCELRSETPQTVRIFNSTVKNDLGHLDMKTPAGVVWYKIKLND